MSRIGNAPIDIVSGVEINIGDDNVVSVKGPKGELSQWVDPCIKVKMDDGVITLSRENDQRDQRSKHGLYRSLIFNMIHGVTQGYTKELELVGVGFRAKNQGQQLELNLGFSHPIIIALPTEIKVEVRAEKGKNPIVALASHDKELIGKVAAKIRSLRKPEPYKGKGVRYVGEYIRRKAGKSAATT
jgi:large subunit ribosomal protein L6